MESFINPSINQKYVFLDKGRFPACWFFSFSRFLRMCGFFSLSAYDFPSQCGLLDKRSLFCKDLYKTKIANTSNIKFSLMTCKASLFLLNKTNYFYLHWFIAKKAYEETKEKKDVISNWSHLNLRSHNFDFHLC